MLNVRQAVVDSDHTTAGTGQCSNRTKNPTEAAPNSVVAERVEVLVLYSSK
jgi:hypothetical protein